MNWKKYRQRGTDVKKAGPDNVRQNKQSQTKISLRTLCLAFVFFCLTAYLNQYPLKTNATRYSQATAYVYTGEEPDNTSHGALDVLRKAGFEAWPLPLDTPPNTLDADMIFFGSYIADQTAYQRYMQTYRSHLIAYVQQGHLLVQMAQDGQYERTPPFLPFLSQTLEAHRLGNRPESLYASVQNHCLTPLMGVTPIEHPITNATQMGEAFIQQNGFQVLLSGDPYGQEAVLMAGSLNLGQVILSALPLDLDCDSELSTLFFRNLYPYVLDVRRQVLPTVKPTSTVETSQKNATDSWSLALLPDVQNYTDRHPGLFIAQTGWIAQNHMKRDIRYVIQLGDFTNHNSAREWKNARMALDLLQDNVPYAFCLGNHDYGFKGDAATRETLANTFLPVTDYMDWPTFGGVMEEGKMDNTFHIFPGRNRHWIVLCLEWAPQNETIEWADSIMQAHPNHQGILVTHAFVDLNGHPLASTDGIAARYSPHHYDTPGTKHDGKQLWDRLVSKHNFKFVFSGHVLGNGNGYSEAINDKGDKVHLVLTNFQMRSLGGEGYMRLLEFLPDGNTVLVKSYSPAMGRYLLDSKHQFEIKLD